MSIRRGGDGDDGDEGGRGVTSCVSMVGTVSWELLVVVVDEDVALVGKG